MQLWRSVVLVRRRVHVKALWQGKLNSGSIEGSDLVRDGLFLIGWTALAKGTHPLRSVDSIVFTLSYEFSLG